MEKSIKINFFFFQYLFQTTYRMKQLFDFFIESPNGSKLNDQKISITFKYGLTTRSATIDSNLKINIQDSQITSLLQLKPSNLMFPHYEQKKVVSITLYNQNSSLSIMGIGNSIQNLYQKLCRVLSHKGFNQFYKPIKRLGRGTFATVYLVQHKYTGIRKAAKVFSRQGQKIQFKGKQALQNEIKTLREIDHPNLIKYDGLYQTESLVYLVTEYLSGGTLDDTLKNKAILTGQLIQSVIKDVLSGLAYLDQNHLMHRDIKPQNIIFRQEQNKWVISDFGLAARSNQDYLYDKCGTMGYIAPQIMALRENQKYAQACDTYSLGVIAYQLIIGQLPFKVQSENFFDKKIVWLLFDRQECKDINPSVLQFLKQLLDKNPETRVTPKKALQSPFFKDRKVVQQLISYHERRRQARYDRILKMANIN